MTTSTEQITALAKDNLFLVFGERTSEKRLEQLKKLWHPSGSFTFLEPGTKATTHEEVDAIITGLLKDAPGFVFQAIGDVQVLVPNGDETVARLKWGFGPEGEEPKVTGEDIFVITEGKIKTLYTFLN